MTAPTHLLLDVYGKCPTLDRLVEKILTDELSFALLRKMARPKLKLRGDNAQQLTGFLGEAPKAGSAPNPHEWHRDSPGEVCISIFLTGFDGPNMEATSLVLGGHWHPYCPRWNCLLGPSHRIKKRNVTLGYLFFKKFSRIIGKFIINIAAWAYVHRGDFYIFINDTWHGRESATNGLPGIKFMVGFYPTGMPFPDIATSPPEHALERLPPKLRMAASQQEPMASIEDTIIKRTLDKQKERQKFIFRLAQIEKQIADWLTKRNSIYGK